MKGYLSATSTAVFVHGMMSARANGSHSRQRIPTPIKGYLCPAAFLFMGACVNDRSSNKDPRAERSP
jgi:hypothetical protein